MNRIVSRLDLTLGVFAWHTYWFMANLIPPVSVDLPELAEYKCTNLKCNLIHFS